MASYIESNKKFHVFSKSPITSTQALAQSVNKSGHTTTTSDVWSQDIPWFFTTDSQAKAIQYSANAKTNDLVDINGTVYKRKDTKTAPYNANGAFDTMWEAFTLADGVVLENSKGEGVILVHQGVTASLLTTSNNANQSSFSAARIWALRDDKGVALPTGQTRLIPQFVQSTDKIVDGFPATGYGVSLWNNNTPISEGEADGNFIANSFAGIIQLNKDYSSPTFTANVFEYIGDKLDVTLDGLSETVKDIVDVSLGNVVANIDTTTAASNAGISVIDTNSTGVGSKTSPQIAFTEGSITDKETKLVSGKTVKKYVDDEIDEQRIWDLNDYLVKNIHLDWVQEAIRLQGHHPYGSAWDLQYVFIPNAKSLYSLEENDVWLTQNSARHRAAADAWINDVLTNGTPKVQLVFGHKDSYATCNLIRRMFWQMDQDAGLEYGSENSYSRRYLKPGLQVKYNTILDDGTARDPFTSNERINAEKLDDSDSNAVQGYVIYTWTGPRKGSDANYGINFGGVPTISPDETWSTHRYQDSIDSPYNWSYTVTENEIKFVQSNSYKALQQVANKLDGIVLSDASKAAGLSVVTEGEGYSKTTPGIDLTTGSVASGVTKLVSGGTVASAIDTAVKITGIQVKVGSGTAQTLTPTNKVVTIEIPGIALNGTAITPTNKVANITAIEGVTTTAVNGVALAKDGNNVKVAVTPASYTKSTKAGSLGTWDNQKLNNVVTAQSVSDAVADVKAYADSLHTTSLDYVVRETLPVAVPTAENAGKIYLVKTGEDQATALEGEYLEYMAVGATFDAEGKPVTYVWEQIGTSAAKLATEALVDESGAIKESVADPNALVNAGDALAAIKLAKPESYIKSVNAEKYTENSGSSSGEVNLNFTHFGGWDGTEMLWDANTNSIGPSYYYAGKLSGFSTNGELVTGVVNNTIIYNDNSTPEGYIYGNFVASDAYNSTNNAKFINTNKIVYLAENEIFANNSSLKVFKSNLDNLVTADRAFYGSSLSEFIVDMPSLETAESMFNSYGYTPTLTTFIGDLSNLKYASSMFMSQKSLTTFISDLGSLLNASNMFDGCSLDTESVECIADTINNGVAMSVIHIDIANENPSDREIIAFNTIHSKGWDVYVKGSLWNPIEPSAITTTDETGEVRTTPIPFYAKAVEVSEAEAEYVDNAGKFYRVLGGQFIYVNDPETYGMFTCLEDAVANMRLTKYVKPEVEAEA